MALFLLISSVFTFALSKQNEHCIFADTLGSGAQFDLTKLDGSVIEYETILNFPYQIKFTPCSNGESNTPCKNRFGQQFFEIMTSMNLTGATDECYAVSVWDDGDTQPSYNQDTKTWSFVYQNGEMCIGTPRIITYNWKCNETAGDYVVTSFTEPNACVYIMNIDSALACNVNMTTTTPPEDICKWNSGNYVLDLNDLKGKIYQKISENDNSISYGLSPCSNILSCNIDNTINNVMVRIFNSTSAQCLSYLALWNNGMTNPNYNSLQQTWQFVYQNGEMCNGFQSVLEVWWRCDGEAGDAIITQARKVTDCTHEIRIDSKYACSTNV